MKSRLAVALVLVGMLAAIWAAAPAVAAEEGIDLSTDTALDFPSSITFSLSATSPNTIDEIFLQYKVDKISTVDVSTVVQPSFQPAAVVETKWTWDMGKMLGSLPPGAVIEYNWEVTDTSGEVVESGWQTVAFDDDRYTWKALTDEDITLLWYDGTDSFGQDLLNSATYAQSRISSDTGAYLNEPVRIYVYANSDDLKGAMLFPQEWMGGVAFSEFGIIAIAIDEENVAWGKRAAAHELAHLITYQMTYNPYSDIPTWLSEGLSTYAEGEIRPDLKSTFDYAVAHDNLISVQSLASSFPSDMEQAILSYAESYSLVSFLLDTYGTDSMLSLFGAFKEGATLDGALKSTYGFDTAGLEKEWRESLGLAGRQEPTPSPGGSSGGAGCAQRESNSASAFVFIGILIPPSLVISRLFLKRAGSGR